VSAGVFLLIVIVGFVAMEPLTAATHRWVMHGIGEWFHRSHHRPGRKPRWERNDWFPVAFAVPPFHAMAMSRQAIALEASGRRVLHLEVGQPSTPLPLPAREAVRQHLDEPLGYTSAKGLQPLRERLADREGVEIARIVVVAGASAGFTLAFLTLFEPGDRVGVLEPGYPCYRNALIALGMTPVPIAVGPDSRWAPTVEHLDRAGELAGLVLASPSNPTGTVLTPTHWRR
jgi:aspartate/methionine/tyrosine aminotransferase